jgi:hypothetical protein
MVMGVAERLSWPHASIGSQQRITHMVRIRYSDGRIGRFRAYRRPKTSMHQPCTERRCRRFRCLQARHQRPAHENTNVDPTIIEKGPKHLILRGHAGSPPCLVPSISSTRHSEAASMVPNGECLPGRCADPSASRHQPGRTAQGTRP